MVDDAAAGVVLPLAKSDAAAAVALADAGVKSPSDLGGFTPPSLDDLAARLDLLERQMAYLRNNYVREHHFPEA